MKVFHIALYIFPRWVAKRGNQWRFSTARLESSPESKAASELVETVLAMDDFVRFKSMMIKLRADLERALQPIEQDFNVRFAR